MSKLNNIINILNNLKNNFFTLLIKLLPNSFVSKNNRSNQFDWSKSLYQIFSPEFRPYIHKIFIFMLIIISTYSLGKIIALVLQSPYTIEKVGKNIRTPIASNRTKIPKNISHQLKKMNVFHIEETQQLDNFSKDLANLNRPCLNSNTLSSLPIELSSTIVLQNKLKSIASLKVRGNRETKHLREGGRINNIAKIGKIIGDQIIIKNLKSGKCEYIKIKKKKFNAKSFNILPPEKGRKLMKKTNYSQITNSGNKFTIDKSFRDEMLQPANISELITQARAIQIKNPDGTISYQITEIVPGSLFSKFNIQNDDIITSINGSKIKNLNEVMKIFNNIKEIDHFKLGIIKDGNAQILEYEFK